MIGLDSNLQWGNLTYIVNPNLSVNDYRRQKATGMKWKLRYLMDEAKDDMQRLADYLGISYQTLSKKLNNHADFSLTELRLLQQRYDLKAEQIFDIFFK